MDLIEMFRQWYKDHFVQIRHDYFRFLQFASISADKAYSKDVLDCALFLTDYFKRRGIHAEMLPTSGFPVVYAEDLSAGPQAPTLLIYGHYDVQPVDPLELWISPPFVPTERDGRVFARGAVDDKGQIFYAIIAFIAWKSLFKSLPVNLKFCIEGEEESHSAGLIDALPQWKKKLEADSLLIVDFDSLKDGTPSVSLGARGCIALEVSLTGSDQDLHSGQMGGLAYNPNRALAELLAKIWDSNGRVAIPGFYEGVQEPTAEELDRFTFAMKKEDLKTDFGIEALSCEKHRTLKESNWFYPTVEINGMFGGYLGEGSKTVIPSKATVKLTCRLVMGQDPQKVAVRVEDFLRKHVQRGIKIDVIQQGGVGAFRSKAEGFLASALGRAGFDVTGKKSVYTLAGGSIPIGSDFARILGCEIVGMGFGLPTDNIHAPNEHFDMDRFEKGFLTVAKTIKLYENR